MAKAAVIARVCGKWLALISATMAFSIGFD
jgi:hypothetical protein